MDQSAEAERLVAMRDKDRSRVVLCTMSSDIEGAPTFDVKGPLSTRSLRPRMIIGMPQHHIMTIVREMVLEEKQYWKAKKALSPQLQVIVQRQHSHRRSL